MTTSEQAFREGPVWLYQFLAGDYFRPCQNHSFNKNERNHFCIDCIEGPLCHRGLQDHTGHRTLQVRKASHADGVRVENVHRLLDISGIQTYIINNHKIVFLLRQSKGKLPTKGSTARHCSTCGRALVDPVKFCSIRCKLVRVQRKIGSIDLSLSPETKLLNGTAKSSCSPSRKQGEPLSAKRRSDARLDEVKMQSTKRRMETQLQGYFSQELNGNESLEAIAQRKIRKYEVTAKASESDQKVEKLLPLLSPVSVLGRDVEAGSRAILLSDFEGSNSNMDLEIALIHQMILASYRRRSRKSSPRRAPLW